MQKKGSFLRQVAQMVISLQDQFHQCMCNSTITHNFFFTWKQSFFMRKSNQIVLAKCCQVYDITNLDADSQMVRSLSFLYEDEY